MHTILLIDDEATIREMLGIIMKTANYHVLQAEDVHRAHSMILDCKPDLVLLDWMMPGISGLELLRRLKRDERTKNIPVIMLTAKAEEDSKVFAFDAGADDYVLKPFSPRELMARIKALLRRTNQQEISESISVGELTVEPACHRVSISGTPISLGPTEYRLLLFFMTHQERVYSRNQIIDYVWGSNVYLDERTVDVHIRRLRKAISVSGHQNYMQTVRGMGYRFSSKLTHTK